MTRRPLIHPVLFALSPVVSLYAHNIMRVHSSAALLPAAGMITAGAIVYGLAWTLSKNHYKAGLITSLALLLCASFGPTSTIIRSVTILHIAIARPTVLLAIWAAVFLVGTLAVLRARSNLRSITGIANVIAIGLFIIPLWTILRFEISLDHSASSTNCTYTNPVAVGTALPDSTPDIYFICLDRYAGNSSLRDYFDYDNSDFTDYLTLRGFYVADGFSNYVMTLQSLAATLNMQYIDCLTDMMGEDSTNRLPLFFMLKDYGVWRILKSKGYKYIHAGTRFHVTASNPNADINYNVQQMPEFTRMFIEQSALFPALNKFNMIDNGRIEKYKRVPHNFKMLNNLPDDVGPKFVFGHFLIPHEPYVFDQSGSYVSIETEGRRTREENYIAQLRYTNECVKELVENLLTKSKRQPIIIIQADEGPYPAGSKADAFRWDLATKDQCREKTRILNAMYLPGIDAEVLYPSISPVNTFRLIFSHYFGDDYDLLPDECYAYYDLYHLYRFVRITDRVR